MARKVHSSDKNTSIEKNTLVNLFTPLVLIAFAIFSVYYFLQGNLPLVYLFLVLMVVQIINFFIFKRWQNASLAYYSFASIGIPILVPWQITGGIDGTGIYWYYLYIVFVFFILGKSRGTVYVYALLLISVAEFLLQRLGIIPQFYNVPTMITFYFGYILQTALLYFSQISKERAQAELEESNAKNDAILQSIGDGLVALDTSGKVVFVNEPVHTLLGWSRKELLGKVWVDLITLLDSKGKALELKDRPFTQVFEKEEKITANYTYLRKDKSALPVSITISPIILNGKSIGAIEVFRDITKEHEVDRMKTEFLSLASHQLRTPLSAMKWNLEMLLAGDAGKLSKEQREMTTNVDDSNERMIGLVNSLLNVSRIESGRIIVDPKMTNLRELVKEVIKEVQQKIDEKHQTLIMSVSNNLPDINIDQQLIRQVYMNILTNAIKYTPEKGEISVFISSKDKEIISQISDNGYGIPSKDKGKVFEKFYRGENITKIITDGNGLGMYLVKSVIDSSGGKIWFESHTPDEKNIPASKKGTTFWFSLPKSGMKANKGEVTLDG